MLRENAHLDFAKIPPELKSRADPRKWLPELELSDWTGETPQIEREFSEEENNFRDRLTELVQSPHFCPLFIDDATLAKMPHVDIFVCEVSNPSAVFYLYYMLYVSYPLSLYSQAIYTKVVFRK